MINSLLLCHTHRYRVRHDARIDFKPGINVLIGPNGSGKSTILRVIAECPVCRVEQSGDGAVHLFHAGIDNPQSKTYRAKGVRRTILHTRGLFSSHGEIMRDVLATLILGEGDTMLLDEPEAGQDLSWIEKIRGGLGSVSKEYGIQFIIASHHPAVMAGSNLIELEPGYIETLLRHYEDLLGRM
jgi:predicted ATPase